MKEKHCVCLLKKCLEEMFMNQFTVMFYIELFKNCSQHSKKKSHLNKEEKSQVIKKLSNRLFKKL